MTLDIDTLGAEPIGEISTPQGLLYVYPPGSIAVGNILDLEALESEEAGRKLLPVLVSLQKRERHSENLEPLPAEVQVKLSEQELRDIARVVRGAVHKDAQLDPEDENVYAYLAKLVTAHTNAENAQIRGSFDKIVGSSVSRMFGDLQSSRHRLGATTSALYELNRRSFDTPQVHDIAVDIFAQQAKERREDRERVHLTSKATAESAEMLGNLAKTAEGLMLKLAEREEKDDRAYRKQLNVAIVSLIAGVVVSGAGTFYAMRSYAHDVEKDDVDAKAVVAAFARDARIDKMLEQSALLIQQNTQALRAATAGTAARPSAGGTGSKQGAKANP
jgi:hypothetical protein